MRFRSTLWMAFFLLLLVAYLFFIEIPQDKKRKEEELQTTKVFALTEEDISLVKIKYPNLNIQLQKISDDHWQITEPLITNADHNEIKSFISTIVDMQIIRVLEDNNLNSSDYGLDHPSIEITLNSDEQEEKVIVGDNGPVTNTLYVKRGSDQRVVLVDQWVRGSLTRSLMDLRNKTILQIDHGKITELILEFPQDRFLITKEQSSATSASGGGSGGQWFLKEPKSAPADTATINNLLLTLSNLRATGFLDLEDEKLKTKKEFGKANLVITLKDNAKNPTISFYHDTEKGLSFAVTTPDRPLFKISDIVLDDFKTDLFHYQDKQLLIFKQENIKRIDIKTLSESFSLNHSNKTWYIEGDDRKVGNEAVKHFLDRLRALKAQNKPDTPIQPEAAGLASPPTEVRLFNSKGKIVGRLAVGHEAGTMLYAAGVPELETVLISKDILDDIPRRNELMEPPQTDDTPGN